MMTRQPDKDKSWIVHGERPVYESEWVTVRLADISQASGERFEHHTVTLKPAAMTVVLDDAGEHVLMAWRHRFVPDVWNWELPGGLLDTDEAPTATAAREVEEETGYRPRSLEHLVTFEPMVGMVRSAHHVYLARRAERPLTCLGPAQDPARSTHQADRFARDLCPRVSRMPTRPRRRSTRSSIDSTGHGLGLAPMPLL